MEKDIEILEKYLRNSAYRRKNSDFFKDGGWEVVDLEIPEALEHLLKEYKKLKVVIEGVIPKFLIEDEIKQLEQDNNKDTEDVKYYELKRRNTDENSYYRKSYQTTIHQLNARRVLRQTIIAKLKNILKGEII